MSFNRTCVVEFDTKVGGKRVVKRISGLNVRFSVHFPMSAVVAEAEIGICNLKRSDLELLTTYTSKAIAINQRKRIRVFAGYSDTQTALIFGGDIFEAKPTEPPDVWLNIKATSVNYATTQIFTRQILVPTSLQTVADQSAKALGLSLEWNSSLYKTIDKFSFSGNVNEMISRINKLADINAFIENDRLVVVDRDDPARSDKIVEISEQYGMIGIPKVTFIGFEAKVLLNTNIRRGDKVELKSSRIPAANGIYYVYHITHEGELRGQPWYTTIDARRNKPS